MKKAIFTILASLSVLMLLGQDVRFQEGDKAINLGLGVGTTLYRGSLYSTVLPPVSASLEIGLIDDLLEVENLNLGVGGYLGFASAKQEWPAFPSGNYGFEYNYIIIGGRAALHYPVIDKLDTYSGLMLGVNIVSSKAYGTASNWQSAAGSGVAYSWFMGGRYYFTDNIAAMAELGYGIAYLNVGIGIKF